MLGNGRQSGYEVISFAHRCLHKDKSLPDIFSDYFYLNTSFVFTHMLLALLTKYTCILPVHLLVINVLNLKVVCSGITYLDV